MEPSSSCKEGRLSGGAISHGVALSVAALFCLLALDSMHATEPSWWTSWGAVNPSATRNDYAMANQGQLKQFTLEAVNEMNANFPPLGSGTGLNTLVGGWISDYATNGYSGSNPKPSDFQVVNVGQLKYIGGMIWTQLEAGGYASSLPSWLVVTSSDSQAANLGQLKTVFDFDLTYSSDGSSLPDWWLIHYFGGLTVSGTTVNPSALVPWSGGQMTYLQAYQQGLNPVDFYNGQAPSLAMISGDNQSADYSVFLPNPLVVAVSIAGIGPVANAPVAFQSPSGGGLLSATPGGALSSTLNVLSGTDGTASVYFACPATGAGPFSITATTGVSPRTASVQFTASTSAPSISPVPAPSNVIPRYGSGGSVFISWTNNDNGQAIGYDIERSTDNQTWTVVATVQATSVYIDTTAPSGTQLFYRVGAKSPQ